MEIIDMKLSDIMPYARNQKKHDKKQIDNVAESIKQFGYVQPIVIDKDNNIIIGHCRALASKKLKLDKVPCVKLEDLTSEEANKLRLLDNKLNESDWDMDLLIEDIPTLDFDGFDIDWGIKLDSDEQAEVIEDDFNEEVPEEPKAKLGDIYKLGEHILMCGDSFLEEDRNTLINNKDIDLIMTDPPYDMQLGGQGCFKESMQHCKDRLSDIVNFDPYKLEFLKNINAKSYYIFTSKNGIPKYLEMFSEMNFNILIWAKTNCPPFTSGTFLPDIEYMMFFSKQGKKIWNNSLKPTEVYKKYYVTKAKQGDEEAESSDHPTIKPQQILQDKIRISSNRGGMYLIYLVVLVQHLLLANIQKENV